jgi:hypothetical protein
MNPILGKLPALLALCLLMAACAQLGPPLPPSLELPKPPSDLRAVRKANRVTLYWSEPTLTTDRQSVRYLGPTLICRSSEPEISACGNPVATLPAPPIAIAKKSGSARSSSQKAAQKTANQHTGPQTYTDTLPPALLKQNPAAEVTYSVEVQNGNARSAGVSNRVHVPAIVTLPPPADLTAQLTGDGVILSWTSTGKLQDSGADPGVQLFYRIYRRDEATGKDAIAAEIPLGEPGRVHFTDSAFVWEKTYLYRVTTVSTIQRPDSQVQVEGDDSATIRVVAHDVFPPAIPTGLQAVYSGEGQKPFIDLIWAPVTNTDLAGYNLYRSASGNNAIKLNSEPVKSPSYRDTFVVSGITYTYTVSSVDVRGNESPRSEPASETVP